jgi:NAD(P)-dependent dehydrogenase (short-subunit alcohol dehydrogenase family)
MTPVAAVTGAATGIGAATAVSLAEAGYAVALWDVDEQGVTAVAKSIQDKGSVAVPSVVDVSSAESVGSALDAVRHSLGTPTAVVSAAGIMAVHPFLELPLESWEATLRVNLTGTFLLLQACGAAMVADGLSGAMVAVASVAARGPRPDAADYAASKAGVVSLVESAAVALAPHGVRVNAICPGVVDTPMTDRNNRDRAARENVTEQEVRDALVARVPLGRMASPREIAAVATRLLSTDFGYVTGQALNVCGGLEFD